MGGAPDQMCSAVCMQGRACRAELLVAEARIGTRGSRVLLEGYALRC